MNTVEKLRSYRIGPFAIFDFTSSYLGAWYIAPYLDKWLTREQVMWLVIPFGIVVHELVGKTISTSSLWDEQSPLNKMILGPDTNLIAQMVVAVMLYKGIIAK